MFKGNHIVNVQDQGDIFPLMFAILAGSASSSWIQLHNVEPIMFHKDLQKVTWRLFELGALAIHAFNSLVYFLFTNSASQGIKMMIINSQKMVDDKKHSAITRVMEKLFVKNLSPLFPTLPCYLPKQPHHSREFLHYFFFTNNSCAMKISSILVPYVKC